MKKTIMFLAAIVLVLGLSQCKKEPKVIEGEVPITLSVKANNGSRIDVNPNTGAVAFENGDVVYVVNGNKFVGTLTCNGNSFTGNISNPTLNEPLYFFFLGNKTPEETLEAGISTSCSVVITDQTTKYPVISFATSDQTFTGAGTYTAYFFNKAALVKFDVTTASQTPTCLLGMNNKVTIDFATNGFAFSQEDLGIITLPAGQGEKWAILLPQASGTREVRSYGGAYSGSTGHIPPIFENDYLTEGIEVNVNNHCYVDLGLPSGLLWAECNIGAEFPMDYGDYFAWGETEPKSYYDWETYQYCNGDYNTLTKYCYDSQFGYNGFTDDLTILEPGDDAATANWGNGWRMPTKEEFEELYNNTTNWWMRMNGVNGWFFYAANGNGLFLPAAGRRYWDDELLYAGNQGCYLSSSLHMAYYPSVAWYFSFESYGYNMSDSDRNLGQSVRPVRSTR